MIDLSVLDRAGSFAHVDLPEGVLEEASLNRFLACGREVVGAVRERLAELIRAKDDRLESSLLPRRAVDLLVPVAVGDFVDFHGSLPHAQNMGRLLRGLRPTCRPNWRRLPRAFHGRAGSIVPSGTPVMRPYGQVPGDDAPIAGITRKLDFEVEVGFVVGVGNEPGHPVRASAFADHVAGLVLVNDWSARDIQALEAQPLGPFLGKSFATSVSPWIVTLDALEPYRVDGPVQDPTPPPYLDRAPGVGVRHPAGGVDPEPVDAGQRHPPGLAHPQPPGRPVLDVPPDAGPRHGERGRHPSRRPVRLGDGVGGRSGDGGLSHGAGVERRAAGGPARRHHAGRSWRTGTPSPSPAGPAATAGPCCASARSPARCAPPVVWRCEMPNYRSLGDVPRKRHLREAGVDGGLLFEELMGEEGFSGDSSLLYHRRSPSALVDAKAVID